MRKSALSTRKRTAGRRRKWWVLLIVLLLAGGTAAWYFLGRTGQAQPASATGTETYTATVKRGDILISASGSGTLTANQSVDLSFSTRGTVVDLNVKLGDMVKAGDVLARLGGAEDLQASLATAQVQLLQAQQALNDLQSNAQVSLAQAYQDKVKAQETYDEALKTSQRVELARCSKEVRVHYAATLDQARQKLDDLTSKAYGSDLWIEAHNNYETALANYNYCNSYTDTEKTTAQSNLDIAQVKLQQANETYQTLSAASGIDPSALALAEAKVDQAEKQVADAQQNLDGIVLTAPIDGKVIYVAAGKGAIVDTTKFITIANVSQPTLDVSVDENDVDKLVMGAKAEVVFDALPDQTFTGTVTQVDPQLSSSGQYQVVNGVAALDDKAAKAVQSLPLGLNASVTIISKEARNVLVVPVEALTDLGNQQYAVMVVGSDGKMKLQTVQVGIQSATSAEITSGLSEGEVVSTGTVQAGAGNSSSSRNNSSGFGPDGGIPPDGMILPPP